jgi:hypothetical protein
MTVLNTSTEIILPADGVLTTFDFPFKVFTASHIVVKLEETDVDDVTMVYGADFTVTGVRSATGGTVVFTVAPPSTKSVHIMRVLPVKQELDLRRNGRYDAESVEEALDKMVMLIQQIASGAISLTDFAASAIFSTWITDIFTGDGTTTSFTLRRSPGTTDNMDVSIGGVVMTPGVDFILSGQNIEFTTPPADDANIVVRYGAATAQTVPIAYHRVTATAAQTEFTTPTEFQPGTNSTLVFMNGIKLMPGVDYDETSTTTIELLLGAEAGDEIEIYSGNLVRTETVSTDVIADAAVTLPKLAVSVQRSLDQVGDFRLGNHPTRAGTWIQCDGATYSRTGYAALFDEIGVTYGVGDGVTTFAVPNIDPVLSGAVEIHYYIKAA